MKQNKWLIQQAKEIAILKKQLKEETVPELYACFCKVLIEDYGKTGDEVEELFKKTEDVWNELVENDEIKHMVDWCEATTGISLRGRKDEQEGTE